MNYSFFSRGSWLRMKSKESPWFFSKINFHISKALFIAADTKTSVLRVDGEILLDKTDKNGLPNGDTQAA